jgi:hypothetical protein
VNFLGFTKKINYMGISWGRERLKKGSFCIVLYEYKRDGPCFHQVQREVAQWLAVCSILVDLLGLTEKVNYMGISWNSRQE